MGRRQGVEQDADWGVDRAGKGVGRGDEGFREELREMKEVVETGLRNVMRVNHLWHWTPIVDVMDYMEWWAGFLKEEMDQEYQEL